MLGAHPLRVSPVQSRLAVQVGASHLGPPLGAFQCLTSLNSQLLYCRETLKYIEMLPKKIDATGCVLSSSHSILKIKISLWRTAVSM